MLISFEKPRCHLFKQEKKKKRKKKLSRGLPLWRIAVCVKVILILRYARDAIVKLIRNAGVKTNGDPHRIMTGESLYYVEQ